MCLAIIALDRHPRYRVVIAANRDEFHARPALPARWWEHREPPGLLAGRDLDAGGTWLGISARGRWAFVTNVREPERFDPLAATRGSLVPELLQDRRGLRPALLGIVARGDAFNGFNLVGGDVADAAFVSNRSADIEPLEPGIHGVSNAQLDTPWPKVERAKAGVAEWLRSGGDALAGLLKRISDNTISGKIAKEVFEAIWAGEGDADAVIDKKGLKQITDTGAIEKVIDEVIAANPKQLEQYRAGHDKLFGFFVGQVMKVSQGKANPAQVNDLLKKKLAG
jgi:hypothetical protein